MFQATNVVSLMLFIAAARVKAGTPPDPSNSTFACVWVSTAVAQVALVPLNTSEETNATSESGVDSTTTVSATTASATTVPAALQITTPSPSNESNGSDIDVITTTASASTASTTASAGSTTTLESSSNDTNTTIVRRRLRGTAFLSRRLLQETEDAEDEAEDAPVVPRILSHSGYWNCTTRANVTRSSNSSANRTNVSLLSNTSSINASKINNTKAGDSINATTPLPASANQSQAKGNNSNAGSTTEPPTSPTTGAGDSSGADPAISDEAATSDEAAAPGVASAGEEDDSVLLGFNAMMLGIIGGAVGFCCLCGGGVGMYLKKKKSSSPVAPDSGGDDKSRRAGIIAKAKAYKDKKSDLNSKAKDAKSEKVEAIKDKAKGYKLETFDVTYDNTKDGERSTWKDIIAACNEANPDKLLEKSDRIVGVEADGASVLDEGAKVTLEVQEDLTVTNGADGKAEDVESVLEKLKEKKSFQLKVERNKKTEDADEANGENGESGTIPPAELETDEEAKERLKNGKKGGGFLKGLKAKKDAKVAAMKEKKAAAQAKKAADKEAKEAKKEGKEDEAKPAEGEEAAKGDTKEEEAKPAEEAKKEEEAKPAEEAKAEEAKPAEGEATGLS
eukprot:gnl/MRDRNA2_/MRDRNA2_91575_c0_seq1.p1 gnl/MRDRNA2_/MRDRNA2_91575_c0~~gnl/MRDRNA2_/MRDRNA2_91575_c0_seq1.p1  ORF type:complete len:621 (+),score=203.51 gnl/MRDRNA2_/MRDRNA2_91575_c0_seq1:115-1977(+)